ncbi:hypothetical protein M9H77_21297 [Catharanthus roseus]|uniref:Uncharacterized protein n=1 Tax=Catharanthus roseus TaxID=4058 RepID=A0ACC0AMB5_CATRO|nr:hypothetical protein M9H77_21297 [Catharanthus roseus]
MVDRKLCYAIVILAGLFIFSSQLTCAQSVNDPVTYVPTSWINKPIVMVNSSDLAKVSPILLSESDRGRFVCGFYCNFNGTGCLFGVLIFQNRFNPETNAEFFLQSPQLVWSANRDYPVETNATLQLRPDGDLVLTNSDGTLVWSSDTGKKPVSSLNLTEMGNLILLGKNNETIWQSFDYPTDSLLLGQKLVPGQKLIASVSATNRSQGLFILSVGGPDGLSAFVNTNPPQKYYSGGLIGHPFVQFDNGSFNGIQIRFASATQFMRFEPDGHLKVYEWGGIDWTVVGDLLKTDGDDCAYPMVCGKYGVCSNGQCSCPETATDQSSFFRQISYRQPNLGCSPVIPISCGNSRYHNLLELRNTNYFTFNLSLYDGRTEVEECKRMCLGSCSCKAALFVYRWDSASKGGCSLLNEVFSIINNEVNQGLYGNSSLFVKVENSPVKKQRPTTAILVSSVGASVILLFIILCSLLFFKERLSKDFEGDILVQVPGMPTRYSYEELKSVTENFSRKLGQGGFGSVYAGTFNNGTMIAVKCLDGFSQVKDSFLVEVQTIGSIHHVNLVKLVGFCSEKSHRLLVYEYMANGSLDRWIFGELQDLTLQWYTRRKIILDIAKGLAYLHEDCSQKIIHFDIKPQNILLDQHFNAKVSDFGLSKLVEKDQSRVLTRMRGTPGYLAPEWLSSVITEKVDVFSFGIVVVEIICGRKNLDWSENEEERHLLTVFKRKAEEQKLHELIDKKCEDMQIHRDEAVEMMKIAGCCLHSDFNKRPSMSLVVKFLEGFVAGEPNLENFEFMNSSVISPMATGDRILEAVDFASPLLPSILSGPR